MIARRLRITGTVQGVWYRGWAVRTAKELRIRGWVRNRSDGSVEALAIGEEQAVERFVAACHQGPPHSDVTGVEVAEEAVADIIGFEQRGTL